MSIEALKQRLPDYAKDLKLNLSSLASEPALTDQQRAGAFVASALAARNPAVTEAMLAEFGPKLSPEALAAAKAAASIMAMNNVYYRSIHLLADSEYSRMPARLRMTALANPAVDKVDFELWCLAVSAVNGCGMCLAAHARELSAKGASREMIQEAIRVAAVIHAAAVILDGEAAAPAVKAAA